MTRLLLSSALAASLLLSGCSTTGTVFKAQGVEISEERTSSPTATLLTFGIIAGAVGLGLMLKSGSGEGDANQGRDTYNDCINAGLPVSHCQSLIT